MCWQVCALLLGPCIKVFDLQSTEHFTMSRLTPQQSSLAVPGTCHVLRYALTVDTRGAVALLTIKSKSPTASADMSSPSTSSRCVASSRSFAVKRRLFTSLRNMTGSRFIRCKAFAAYIHLSPRLSRFAMEHSLSVITSVPSGQSNHLGLSDELMLVVTPSSGHETEGCTTMMPLMQGRFAADAWKLLA